MGAARHGIEKTLEKGRAGLRSGQEPRSCVYAPLLKGFCISGGRLDGDVELPARRLRDVFSLSRSSDRGQAAVVSRIVTTSPSNRLSRGVRKGRAANQGRGSTTIHGPAGDERNGLR